jgi:hypothetical protein
MEEAVRWVVGTRNQLSEHTISCIHEKLLLVSTYRIQSLENILQDGRPMFAGGCLSQCQRAVQSWSTYDSNEPS